MANYFANSAIGPNISTIDANGPNISKRSTIERKMKDEKIKAHVSFNYSHMYYK